MRTPRRRAARGPGTASPPSGGLGLLLFWFILVGQIQPAELAAGAAAATLSAYAWRASAEYGRIWFRPGLRWLIQSWRIPKSLVQGTWTIFGVLARQLLERRPAPSLLVAAPFEAGGDRRALAVAYTTVTPDFVVVGVDREKGRLVYHQIRHSAALRLPAELGARR